MLKIDSDLDSIRCFFEISIRKKIIPYPDYNTALICVLDPKFLITDPDPLIENRNFGPRSCFGWKLSILVILGRKWVKIFNFTEFSMCIYDEFAHCPIHFSDIFPVLGIWTIFFGLGFGSCSSEQFGFGFGSFRIRIRIRIGSDFE